MIKDEIAKSIKKILSDEQSTVFASLVEFLRSKRQYCALIGYAGTGKTFTVSRLIESLNGTKVVVTAPTNKAVKVLMENRTMDNKVEYRTIHKLLQLRVKWAYPKGKRPYQKLVKASFGSSEIEDYDVIIIDEASMLDDELFVMLDAEKRLDSKVIFMGDPAQIPPVNKEDSIPLQRQHRDTYDIDALYLEKIMRQKSDNKILETASQIRENRFNDGDPILNRISSNDVIFCSQTQEDREFFMKEILLHFESRAFKEDANYAKVIAWRNAVVSSYNDVIRKHLFKTNVLQPLYPSEKLIADTPVIIDRNIIFNTSDEFEVISFQDAVTTYDLPPLKYRDENQQTLALTNNETITYEGEAVELKYFQTVVEHTPPFGESYRKQIDILHPDYVPRLKHILSRLIKVKRFREYEKMTERFAQVKYNYAITAHKSQGSTYNTVFLIEDDIDINRRIIERNRIKYTACTRPNKRLFILSNNNPPLRKQL